MGKNHIFFAATVLIVTAVSSVSAEVLYHVIDLGILDRLESRAWSINNKGQIVGEADANEPYWYGWHPVLFDGTGDGNNVDLIAVRRDCGHALSINGLGQVAGWTSDCPAVNNERATLFDPTGDGNNVELEAPEDWASKAFSINNSGQIVGTTFYTVFSIPLPSVLSYATLFDTSGGGNHVNLGTLGGGWSEAWSVNDSGQIVGMARTGSGSYRATRFDPSGGGNNVNLGTLSGGDESYALSINDLGQIAGYARNSGGDQRATLFDPSGSGNNIDLGTLGSGGESAAFSINNAGDIVGSANGDAVLFDPSGGGDNINLNSVIPAVSAWHLQEATCINDSGWIVGSGKNPEGRTHAFLLRPVSPYDLTLTLDVEPNDVGIDTVIPGVGEHKLLKGEAMDLQAELFKSCPAVYHFDHWDGDVVDANSPLTTVIMDADKTITAVFVAAEATCGDECHPIVQGDLNGDCYVNFADFVLYSDKWMTCTHPDCD